MSDAKSVAYAAMARGTFTRLQGYLQRGRKFETTNEEDLAEFWVKGMKAWAVDIRSRSQDLDDADSEYELREQTAPFDRVMPEFEAIIANVDRVAKGMSDEDRERANSEMTAEYEAERNRQN